MKITIAFLLFFSIQDLAAQPGCTDPQALNFNPDATENDGSCAYPMTDYSLTQIAGLPDILKECSGVELLSSGLWIHNDGGNEHHIFRIDSVSGDILQTAILGNAENIDWEDFAESDNYLYLGDFGNNLGNRTDLKIYRINKNDLANDTINVEVIEFSYSDQVDFLKNNNNHNFDCEAFVFFNDRLHLFTKNWVDNKTNHYTLSAEPGTHTAQLQESFDVNGLITGAEISADHEIVLLGYTEFGFNFMWLLFDFNEDFFFSGNKRKISLGTALTNSQTEGITFRENGYGYICAEEFKVNDQLTLPQKLLSFSISQWISDITSTKDFAPLKKIAVYPNPSRGFFEIENKDLKNLDWKLYNKMGRLLKSGNTTGVKTRIDIATLPAGVYYLLISNGKHRSNFTLFKE